MTMKIKAALVIMGIVFILTVASFTLSSYLAQQHMTANIGEELSLALDIAETVVATKITLLKSNAETVAERLLKADSAQGMKEIMALQHEEFREFASLTVYDRNGIVLHYGNPVEHDVFQTESKLMRRVFDNGEKILSSPHYNSANGDLIMHVFVPMKPDMVLSATITGMLFSDILSRYRLWQTGSIFMIDENGTFIANYRPEFVTRQINFIEQAKTDSTLEEAGNLYQKMISSKDPGSGRYTLEGKERICVYKYVTDSIVGWRLGAVAPLDESPQSNAQNMLMLAALFFLIAGGIVSVILSGIVIRPFKTIQAQAAQIQDEHERLKLLMDATPLACRLWNKNFKVFECNDATISLHGLKDKEEFVERVFDLSPEYQPDGQLSREKVVNTLKKVFEEGRDVFEWMHQTLDGEPIPCEITLVRVNYGDDHVIAGYTRDLREHKKMMKEIERHDKLLTTGNSTAEILLSIRDEAHIETSLMESMELVGRSVDVDRVQIWRNEMLDGSRHFVHTYEWLSDVGRQKTPVPTGLKFPYRDKANWESMFLRGECINGPVSALPPGDQAFLSVYDMKTIVIIPLFLQDEFWGFFRLDDCRQERTFTKNEIAILHSVSLMMANAFDRNAQAAKIREANKYTALLIEAMPFVCNLWDKNIHMFKSNEGSVRMFGVRDKQEFMERFHDLSPEYQPDGRRSSETVLQLIRETFEKGRYVGEWMHQKLDGSPLPTEVTLVRVAHGDDYVVACYVRDLSEQKRMLAEIGRSVTLLSAVNRAAGILLHSELADFATDLRHCMGMFAKAVGVDRISIWKNHTENGKLYYYSQVYEWADGVELPNEKAARENVKEPRYYAKIVPNWEAALAKGECINSRVRDMAPSEQSHFAAQGIQSVFVTPVLIENQFWGFVGYDNYHYERSFTENEQMIMNSAGILIANALLRNEMMLNIRDASVKLEEAYNDATRANNAKSNFLAKMSHEMRTPLNAIIGLTDLTLENEELDEDSSSNLEKISNAGMTLLRIVNDLLDISKIESGKLEFVPAEYDIPSLLNDTMAQSIMYIGEKPIQFIPDIDRNLFVSLYGDELRVKQIFNNILSNAFKYTKAGTVKFRVSCQHDGDEVWIAASVSDTGIGIRPEDVDRLFTEFAQLDMESNRKITGTGLGLPITKKLVEMMGGSISVESEYGKGSTFTVRFPQKFVSDIVIGQGVRDNLKNFRYIDQKRKQDFKLERIQLPNARVLVVDDVPTNLDVAKGMMKPYGMRIDCVTSGQKAIDLIRDERIRYNAVFMDHMMPEMDGMEAVRIIREEIGTEYARTVPIIALTANAIMGSEAMFLRNGFQAFLSKPIGMARLDAVIRAWVRDTTQENLALEQQHLVPGKTLTQTLCGREVAGLNINKGIKRFAGDEEQYLVVLRSYAAYVPSILEKINEPSQDALTDYGIIVHGVKGSSRNICANRLAGMAEKLEYAAKVGDFDYIAEHNASFREAAFDLVSRINDLLKQVSEKNPKPMKDKPDKDVLHKIAEACKQYDMDSAEAAMAELEQYDYEYNGELVVWIWENLQAFNINQIIERLSDLPDASGA